MKINKLSNQLLYKKLVIINIAIRILFQNIGNYFFITEQNN